MTLGGLAIAVGLLVDAAIIMVENILHRLSGAASRRERRERALSAAIEVARPIAFATFIVIVVFLPLFGMSGIEGRMYQPLAAAVIAAMAAALVLAVTLVPIAAALVLRPSRSRHRRGRRHPAQGEAVVCASARSLPAPPEDGGARHTAHCTCHVLDWASGSAATSCPSSMRVRFCCRRSFRQRPRSTKSTV